MDFEEIEEELVGSDTIRDIKELREALPDLTKSFNNIELYYIWSYYSNKLCAGWLYPKSMISDEDALGEIKEIFAKFSFYLGRDKEDE